MTDETSSSSVAIAKSSMAEEASSEPNQAAESTTFSLSSAAEDGEPAKLAREFRTLCSRHANQTNAQAMLRYMRNQFSFFGIKASQRRQLQKEFAAEHREKLAQRPFLLRFAVALWGEEERECQLYGVDLAAEFKREILGETRRDFDEAVAWAEVLIKTKSWWDTVDLIASQCE